MENMGTVIMNIDSLNILTIDVSTKMMTLVDYKTTFTMTVRHTGKGGAINTGPNNQLVVLFVHKLFIFLQK